MFVLVTYDINTESAEGKKRLRSVAKHCVNFGQRVQNSVFECELDNAQMTRFRHDLLKLIDPANDSVRIYAMGDKYRSRAEHYGAKPGYDAQGLLML